MLYRLHDLYGFDPIRDLAIDAMHTIVLNRLSNLSLPTWDRMKENPCKTAIPVTVVSFLDRILSLL